MNDQAYETILNGALAQLQSARELIVQEISNYPTPISGCDAQFNHLLGDRSRITKAIQALKHMPFVPTPRVLEPGATPECR